MNQETIIETTPATPDEAAAHAGDQQTPDLDQEEKLAKRAYQTACKGVANAQKRLDEAMKFRCGQATWLNEVYAKRQAQLAREETL